VEFNNPSRLLANTRPAGPRRRSVVARQSSCHPRTVPRQIRTRTRRGKRCAAKNACPWIAARTSSSWTACVRLTVRPVVGSVIGEFSRLLSHSHDPQLSGTVSAELASIAAAKTWCATAIAFSNSRRRGGTLRQRGAKCWCARDGTEDWRSNTVVVRCAGERFLHPPSRFWIQRPTTRGRTCRFQ
jgi:hypothetical protein